MEREGSDRGEQSPVEGSRTARARERAAEEQRYVPVIIKRTDEAVRHPDDILSSAVEEGLEQLERPGLSLALSALAAGLILGFTAMSVGVVTTIFGDDADPGLLRLATALVYPLGFVICMMSGTQLFTEHTATAVYPVLDRKAGTPALLRLWTVVACGNLLGAMISALLLAGADAVIGVGEGYAVVGRHLVEPPTASLVLSAVLAGWLMALGAWLILATPPRVSQVVLIYIVTFLIGLGGLHHSIAGSVELFLALLTSDAISASEAMRFLTAALLGNLGGGTVFVAALNYGHIRKSQAADPSPAGRQESQGG